MLKEGHRFRGLLAVNHVTQRTEYYRHLLGSALYVLGRGKLKGVAPERLRIRETNLGCSSASSLMQSVPPKPLEWQVSQCAT